ncbi:MAG: PTPA-CTERM sorting domain-containing protein [Coleofasciculus sp. C3-bin4]|nr:PTPA-CTERM sorting domain-containing protein [Coleofasciculus sp. C3-bin4]
MSLNKTAFIGAAALVLSIGITGEAQAASVTVGVPNLDGNSYPFSGDFEGRYQQVYSSSSFLEPLNIKQLSFFNTVVFPGTASIQPATYKIRLSTTDKGVNQLEISPDDNLGADVQAFFEGVLEGPTGAKFDIVGNSFLYDPSKGNLLMDIFVSGLQRSGIPSFLDADTNGLVTSRLYAFGSDPATLDKVGLVTQFTGDPVTPVPTPALLPGLIGMGVAALRKRKQEQAEVAEV